MLKKTKKSIFLPLKRINKIKKHYFNLHNTWCSKNQHVLVHTFSMSTFTPPACVCAHSQYVHISNPSMCVFALPVCSYSQNRYVYVHIIFAFSRH